MTSFHDYICSRKMKLRVMLLTSMDAVFHPAIIKTLLIANLTKHEVRSSTSLFHSKENVGATHELQTNKEIKSTCIKDSQSKSMQ